MRELRDRGGIINTQIVLAVGLGVVTYKDASMLVKYGGSVVLTKHWAKYLFHRMNIVKRRGNTKAKVTMENFDELRTAFILDAKRVMVRKTDSCLPHYQFPEDWHITSTPTHWSKEDATRVYIEKIIISYLCKKSDELNLNSIRNYH